MGCDITIVFRQKAPDTDPATRPIPHGDTVVSPIQPNKVKEGLESFFTGSEVKMIDIHTYKISTNATFPKVVLQMAHIVLPDSKIENDEASSTITICSL